MALFSRIVNYQELSTQKMKEEYGDLHPKILDLGMRLINESYQSSNQRCIAMLLALKHFINVNKIHILTIVRISKLRQISLYIGRSYQI